MNKRARREIIRMKFNNKCAYCGCELTNSWHIDEIEPCRRNMKWNKNKTAYVHDGTYEHPERLHIDNQYPACASCNINKHSMSLEHFRSLIAGFMKHLNEINTQYKIAKRYGLVIEQDKPVIFYFETFKQTP